MVLSSCRSRRGKIRARSLSQPQRNPATRTFPPVARRRADYHTAQEEAGHLSHAPVSDIVSDASDDLEVDGAMLSEEAALRDGEDFIMSDRVSPLFIALDQHRECAHFSFVLRHHAYHLKIAFDAVY